MNLSKPLSSLIPTLEADVLTVLAGAQGSFTGRQVHALAASSSESGVRNALKRLNTQGIVTRTPVGAADQYSLNHGHLMTKYIKSIVNLRSEFLRLIEEEVSKWEIAPVCAAVFGSSVRVDMHPESDIDIFLVRPKSIDFGLSLWRAQCASLSSNITSWTGNDAQIFELNEKGIDQELTSKDGVIFSIIEDGIIFFGPSDFLRALRQKKASNSNGNNEKLHSKEQGRKIKQS